MELINLREVMNPELFDWVVLPLLIFTARLIDVTLGTLRILFIGKGIKMLAAFVGFFESLIWLFAISQIVQNLSNLACYFSFASGFAIGNYVGIYIEGKLAVGLLCVRAVTPDDASELIQTLRKQNYGVTSVAANGLSGQVGLIWSVIKRKDLEEFLNIIRNHNPRSFISVEDVKSVQEGIFPTKISSYRNSFGLQRK